MTTRSRRRTSKRSNTARTSRSALAVSKCPCPLPAVLPLVQRRSPSFGHRLHDACCCPLRPSARNVQTTFPYPGRSLHGQPQTIQGELSPISQAAGSCLDKPTENGAHRHQQKTTTALTKLTSPGVSRSLTNSARRCRLESSLDLELARYWSQPCPAMPSTVLCP